MRCDICGAEMVFAGKMRTFSDPSRCVSHYICPRCGHFVVVPEGDVGGK